jgi:hypothetical protein
MSRAAHVGVIACEAESSWGENVATYTTRLPHVGRVDVSGILQAKQDSNRLVQYRNEGTMPIIGVQGGTFSITLWLTGHGSSTSGATTAGEVETVLGHFFGTSASTGTGTTFTGGTATAPTTTASGTLTTGGIGFAGVLLDSGGGGQPFVISSHSATTLNLLTALPAAPTNGQVCYSAVNLHSQETPSSAGVQSYRFVLGTANLQYRCHGCYPMSITFTGLGPGETPQLTATYGVSWWSHAAETFPSTDSLNDFMPAPNAGGSLFFQTRGTATRATLAYRSFALTYTLGMQAVKGPGGRDTQDIMGAVRTRDEISMEVVVDSENATTSPTHAGNWDSTTQFYHLLLGLNAAASGQRVAFYFPNVCYDRERPVQVEADNINRVRLRLRAYTGPTTTSELTLSAFRMAWG